MKPIKFTKPQVQVAGLNDAQLNNMTAAFSLLSKWDQEAKLKETTLQKNNATAAGKAVG